MITRLENIVEQVRGVSYKPSDLRPPSDDHAIILLRAHNIQEGTIVLDDVVYVSKDKVSEKQYLQKGDVLVCTSSGSKELVGKAAFFDMDCPMTFGAFCKVIRPKSEDPKYIAHFFQSPYYRATISSASAGANINNLRNEHFSNLQIHIPALDKQRIITTILDKVSALIAKRKQQLARLDELVKARFVEMFGDPIKNSKSLPSISLGRVCYLKAGITTPAEMIHSKSDEYNIPCYGGNGIRGYVKEATQHGAYPIIGRQGALCGNVKLATGHFHATEHAVLVTPLVKTNVIWLFYLLNFMDLYRYHTGAAQPGLAVKTLNTIEIPIAEINAQHDFATFVEHSDRSKSTIQQSLTQLETLKKSLMQQYFG